MGHWRGKRRGIVLVALAVSLWSAAPARAADPECVAATTSVTDARRVSRATPVEAPPVADHDVELGDVIELQLKDFQKLLGEQRCRGTGKDIVLFLDGRPMPGLTPFPPTNPAGDKVRFTLQRKESSRDVWAYILGRPGFDPRPVEVSIGLEDRYAVPTSAKIQLRVIPLNWFLVWLALFVLMVGLTLYLGLGTTLLRGGTPAGGETYSLAKTQAAWWFFVVMASYLGIGLITGDYTSTINQTVIVLLGIGSGTAIGSAVIDASKTTDDRIAANQAATEQSAAEVADLTASVADLSAQAAAFAPAGQLGPEQQQARLGLLATITQQKNRLARQKSALRKLRGESEGLLRDILSDANGVSFHRFQIVAWTIVLSIIFIKQVYENLAMPSFNDTLLGLQGLSAGTYLGLKLPESTQPTQAPVPAAIAA